MMFSRFLPAVLALGASAGLSLAGGEGWLTDFEKARKQAAGEKKDLLVDFTGSDWCGYCIQLSENVFETEAFAQVAPKHFVLVELDFPRNTEGMSEATIAQNQELAELYHIGGYPTIILMDSEGRPYARTGFRPGDAAQYLAHLEELRQVRVERDKHLATAAGLEGPAKAKALAAALTILPDGDISAFYKDIVDALVAADPDDESGFQKARSYRQSKEELARKIGEMIGAREFDQAQTSILEFLEQHDPQGIDRQEILMGLFMIHMERRSAAAALAQLEAIKKIDPDSEIGRQVDAYKQSAIAFLKEQEDAQDTSEEGSSE